METKNTTIHNEEQRRNSLHEENTLRDRVLFDIESGRAKMKPRWHFVLQTMLFLLGTVVVSLLLVYALSLSLFVADQNGLWFLPSFGMVGLRIMFSSLPWLLIFFVLLFLIVLQILVKQYAFAYHRPLFYSALASLVFVIFGSLVLLKLGFHHRVYEYASQNKMPLAAPLYETFCYKKFKEVHPGQIMLLLTQGFRMQNPHGELETVVVTGQTKYPYGMQFLVGDHVIVIGREHNEVIEAEGIRKIVIPRYIQIRKLEPTSSSNERF